MTSIALGFLPKPLVLGVESLLPSVGLSQKLISSHKFRQIRASIAEIGLIEPLSVTSADRKSGRHVVLDGHLRLQAVKELGHAEIACLVSTDDESFTYNNHLNRLSTVQEHMMIRRALDRGIPAAKLAKGLCIDISLLRKKNSLLDGICAEVVEILKDRTFSAEVTQVLRQMKPTRQIECAELMVSANTVTASYVRCLLTATQDSMLVAGRKPSRPVALSQEQVARMKHEMTNLQGRYKSAEQSYSDDVLNLMLARSYIVKLMDNNQAMKYMQKHFPEVLEEFSRIVEMSSTDV
ncbi:MAG: ParB N-terminal domain-containing protein [Burkholderiaceae bacterium]|nr:ParB N-terminal domain-containing protein [Burkholderiaceae bacterium]